jgi:hypothetical protein
MAVEYLDNGNDDGMVFGQTAASKIGFYGLATPIVQPTMSASVMTVTTLTDCLADLLIIKAVLVNLGLVTSA